VQLAPAFAEAATSLEPHILLGKVDTEKYQELASQHSISSLPTMVLFHKGEEIARQAGAMDTSAIVQWTRSQLAPKT
jgi:thioredoxin 2